MKENNQMEEKNKLTFLLNFVSPTLKQKRTGQVVQIFPFKTSKVSSFVWFACKQTLFVHFASGSLSKPMNAIFFFNKLRTGNQALV